MTDDLTGDLDLLGDWLDAKGYGEEAGLCTRVMDHMHKQDAYIAELRKEADMMHSEYKTAAARIAALEAALKPFAEQYDAVVAEFGMLPDDANSIVKFGELRDASEAMKGGKMKNFDENSYCPKCHSDKISSLWVEENSHEWRRPFGDDERKEHIHRHCVRCGYKWNELPLDARAALEGKDG